MVRQILLVTLTAVFLLSLSEVSAGGFSLGPHIGYQKAKDANEGKFMFGATARLKLIGALAAEGTISYRQEKYGQDDVLTVKSWPIMVTGLLYPIPIVYAGVGIGWHRTTYDFDENKLPAPFPAKDETKTDFGWHLGAGVELPLGGMDLVGDIRYVFLDRSFPDFQDIKELNGDFFMITAGLLFRL